MYSIRGLGGGWLLNLRGRGFVSMRAARFFGKERASPGTASPALLAFIVLALSIRWMVKLLIPPPKKESKESQ